MSDGFRPVCGTAELDAGPVARDCGPVRVAVFRHGGQIYALNETCPHRGGPLHLGEVTDGIVRCPWHLWQFALATGVSPVNPRSRVATYPVRVENDRVLVRVPDRNGAETPARATSSS